jgi:hypothetical protein
MAAPVKARAPRRRAPAKRGITTIEANASKARLLKEVRKVVQLLRQGRRREAEKLMEKIASDDSLWLWVILEGLEEPKQ